jgi:hypothetical protein
MIHPGMCEYARSDEGARILFDLAFKKERDPVSEEYKAGVLYGLRQALEVPGYESFEVQNPYKTLVQFDAFRAGIREAKEIIYRRFGDPDEYDEDAEEKTIYNDDGEIVWEP